MELNEIGKMEPGEFVRYTGPKNNRASFQFGKLYEVLYVRPDGAEFVLKVGRRIRHNPDAKEWDPSSFERLDERMNLNAADYQSMIDYALDTKDFEWLAELRANAFPSKKLSEH